MNIYKFMVVIIDQVSCRYQILKIQFRDENVKSYFEDMFSCKIIKL